MEWGEFELALKEIPLFQGLSGLSTFVLVGSAASEALVPLGALLDLKVDTV